MKIYAISDLHLSNTQDKPMEIFGESWEGHWDIIRKDWLNKVNADDIVLLTGDLSWAMKIEDAVVDLNEIAALPGKKVIIRGNHDYWWGSYSKVTKMLPLNMFAIQNDSLRLGNVLLCGSRGWLIPDSKSNADDKKIYARELIRLKLSLDAMAKKRKDDDIVIGMMHFPPFNSQYNDSQMTELFSEYHVHKVVYGHLHSIRNAEKITVKDDITYYLSSCDLVNNNLVEIV